MSFIDKARAIIAKTKELGIDEPYMNDLSQWTEEEIEQFVYDCEEAYLVKQDAPQPLTIVPTWH